MKNHEIDYVLHGDDMQFVEVELDPQETVVAEAGSLMMMDDQIRMETIFGDGSKNSSSSMVLNDTMLTLAFLLSSSNSSAASVHHVSCSTV